MQLLWTRSKIRQNLYVLSMESTQPFEPFNFNNLTVHHFRHFIDCLRGAITEKIESWRGGERPKIRRGVTLTEKVNLLISWVFMEIGTSKFSIYYFELLHREINRVTLVMVSLTETFMNITEITASCVRKVNETQFRACRLIKNIRFNTGKVGEEINCKYLKIYSNNLFVLTLVLYP